MFQVAPRVPFLYEVLRPLTLCDDTARRSAPGRVAYIVAIWSGSPWWIGLLDVGTVRDKIPVTMVEICFRHAIDALDSLRNIISDGKRLNVPIIRLQSR